MRLERNQLGIRGEVMINGNVGTQVEKVNQIYQINKKWKLLKRGREKAAVRWSWLPKCCNTSDSIDSHQERKCTPVNWLRTNRPILQGTEKRKASWCNSVQKALKSSPEEEVTETRQTNSRNKERKHTDTQT